MFKKIICLAFAVLTAFSVLSLCGCKKKEIKEEDKEPEVRMQEIIDKRKKAEQQTKDGNPSLSDIRGVDTGDAKEDVLKELPETYKIISKSDIEKNEGTYYPSNSQFKLRDNDEIYAWKKTVGAALDVGNKTYTVIVFRNNEVVSKGQLFAANEF